jgi:hypothetical protein
VVHFLLAIIFSHSYVFEKWERIIEETSVLPLLMVEFKFPHHPKPNPHLEIMASEKGKIFLFKNIYIILILYTINIVYHYL